jgi:hypothetical protein
MEKYRKEIWHYNNDYDRATIAELKALEKKITIEQEKTDRGKTNDKEALSNAINTFEEVRSLKFKIKDRVITNLIQADEQKDRLVSQHPVPQHIRCAICGSPMVFEAHIFKNDDRDILFVLSCPKKHLPKKMIYSDGTEYPVKRTKRTCEVCGGEVESFVAKVDQITTFTDTCKRCKHTETWEMDDEEDLLPIDEEERKKYCTDFIDNSPSALALKPLENLMPILNIIREVNESAEKKELYEPQKVEKLNIPQLEQRLTEAMQQEAYVKVQFEKPKFGKQALMEFSVQDPTNRDSKQSLKILRKTIEQTLFTTNWRLKAKTVAYRMGFLNGQLIGYEKPEDIMTIAKEIYHRNNLPNPASDSEV